jgi:hypothetical protein
MRIKAFGSNDPLANELHEISLVRIHEVQVLLRVSLGLVWPVNVMIARVDWV